VGRVPMAFTVVASLVGGALIGASASALLVLNGRVAGISGMLGGLVRPERGEWSWRLAFVGGLAVGGALLAWLRPELVPSVSPGVPWPLIVVAGLLVGFGTQLGNGCTSGHGVCGISRLSVRSLAATLIFMLTGALSAYAVQRLFGAST
jgi:uncharacterized membrane protein YedE/YeeE